MTALTMAAPRRSLRLQITKVAGPIIGWALLGVVALWAIANLIHAPSQFLSAGAIGFSNGVIYALIALGYTLVYGIIELINFAHGDLFMIGTLLSAIVVNRWLGLGGGSSVKGWLGVILAFIVAMTLCATVNFLIEFFAYRRLRHAPKLAPLITAVGFSFILQNCGQIINGSGQKTWPTVFPTGFFTIGNVEVPKYLPIVLGATIPLLMGMSWIVAKTRQGKAMRATAQDIDAARLMGINVNRTISFTFALGGALAGFAGVMFQQSQGYTRFDLGFQLGLYAFTAAVLGGIGNLTGAVIGGVLIGLVQGLNDGADWAPGQHWTPTVIFTILILVMVFKPEGILGRPSVEKV